MSISSFALFSCTPDLPEDVSREFAKLPAKVDYNIHVKPILSDKCFACHGPDPGKRKAELRLDVAAAAFATLPESPGKVAIDPGNPGRSELVHRILSSDPEYMMPDPESHHTLSDKEKAILIKWIDDGAVYKPHWAFVKPELSRVPDVGSKKRIVNPIDNFIVDKLEKENLPSAKEAEKELLLRRISLDLTGLPPTLEEIGSFLRDKSSDAYEKQVDRLLASPHYGERMAVDWLDLARFADSHGYSMDPLRDMSPYRDWVIKAFNQNLPYDKFIHQQLAGDLMPDPTKDMIIATAFNRNHQQNMEGGIIEEEFQTEYVVDRTNTFGDAFLGLSVGCARCHDHKFDPVTQKNYYELFSFFNNVREAGQISFDNGMPTPTLLLPTDAEEKVMAHLSKLVNEQEKKIEQLRKGSDADFDRWLNRGAYARLSNETVPLNGLLARYTFDNENLTNSVGKKGTGVMRQQSGTETPVFEKRDEGKALVLNGDGWLDLKEVGIFRKSETFSIAMWVNIPDAVEEGVVFHKTLAERLFNFRGYHLYLKNNKFELSMAHAAPSDAILKVTKEDVPRKRWIHLAVTYDASSKASGFKLYLDGNESPMETVTDHLVKDILFHKGVSYGSTSQPGLQVGAWDRGSGLAGGKVDDIVVYNRELTPFEVTVLAGKTSWSRYASGKQDQLSASGRNALKEYYLSAVDAGMLQAAVDLKALRTALADTTENIREIMVMREMPHPKRAFILQRGSYDAHGEEVFPNTPGSLLSFPDNLPRNRYGLAQWLTLEDHPLTARVAVNRFWQMFFGTGLVKTAEDFGNQGELPSHPELLDWLAVTFRESGWDIKKLMKLIAMSATYRQDSRTTSAIREKDPENRLLSHGPAFRMSAEMIRDNALAASGLLNKQVGGRSIKPYQPEGLWQINNTSYSQDTGQAVYRRSLYILTKRSVPHPTLATFDATSRSYCVVRRQKTNTPLQALVTLNDPAFIETATALGAQMANTTDTRNAIVNTFRRLTGRTPSSGELDLLADLQKKQLKTFRQHPGRAKGWLHAGQFVVPKNVDPLLTAANAVVASTILNSDAALTRR